MATGEVLHGSDQNFAQDVLESPLPVLVDFWAPWCTPCRSLAPILDELAKEYEGRLRVLKINVDENQVKAGEFGVRSIPNLILFHQGKKVDQLVGAAPKAQLKALIGKAVPE